MKKLLQPLLTFILLAVLYTNTTRAQYNTAYAVGISGMPISATALDHVMADPGNQCILGVMDQLPYVITYAPGLV